MEELLPARQDFLLVFSAIIKNRAEIRSLLLAAFGLFFLLFDVFEEKSEDSEHE